MREHTVNAEAEIDIEVSMFPRDAEEAAEYVELRIENGVKRGLSGEFSAPELHVDVDAVEIAQTHLQQQRLDSSDA